MKKALIAALLFALLLCACGEETPAPTLPSGEEEEITFTSQQVKFSESDDSIGAVFGLNKVMEVCQYGGVTYGFEKTVAMEERTACIRATQAVLDHLDAGLDLQIYIFSNDSYGKTFVKGNALYTCPLDWQSPEYMAALIQAVFGEYCNYGAAYGYGSYLCGQLFGQEVNLCGEDWAYEGNEDILDLNVLCFRNSFFDGKDIKAARRIANTFADTYIRQQGETAYQQLMAQSGDPAQAEAFARVLGEFYGELGIAYQPSSLVIRSGGEGYDYIVKSQYAVLFVETDWEDKNQGLCPEYYEDFLHKNYADVRRYFTVNIEEMGKYQEFFGLDAYDNDLNIYFTNHYNRYAVSYIEKKHAITVQTVSSFSTGYFTALMEQTDYRQEGWAVTGFTQIFGWRYNTYGNTLSNYIANVTKPETSRKYREACLRYLGRDLDYNTDLYVIHHIEACIDQETDPNKNYISGGSFVAYLAERFGEQEVVDIVLNRKDFEGTTYEELVADWQTFLAENYAQYAEEAPPVTEPGETEPLPTQPEHTALYVSGVSQEDMILYFNEVVLNVEYADGAGDTTLVQKWTDPIRFRICGDPTDEDRAVLADLFAQLNEIPGFPGIYEAQEGETPNLTLYFQSKEDFERDFASVIGWEEADGAMQFSYYIATNVIFEGRIGYRTDISQQLRNSVLVEEVINLLGISDTVLRSDSIVYQYGSDATGLSDVDWAILKLLYDPEIQCGMNAEECREVLERLYY